MFSFSVMALPSLGAALTPWSSDPKDALVGFLLRMHLKTDLVLVLKSFANCSTDSYLACRTVFLHLTCKRSRSFPCSSFGYGFSFMKDVFLVLITSVSLLFSHASFFLFFLNLWHVFGLCLQHSALKWSPSVSFAEDGINPHCRIWIF